MEGEELLAELNKDIVEYNAKIGALNKIKALISQYSDLTRYPDRWGNVRYGTTAVNAIAVEYERNHSCGCCRDAALIIRPYIKLADGQIVYSKPAEFYVGNGKSWGDGDVPKDGWKEYMEKCNIHPTIITAVERHFELYKNSEDEDDEAEGERISTHCKVSKILKGQDEKIRETMSENA
jgi:hypothetical protein